PHPHQLGMEQVERADVESGGHPDVRSSLVEAASKIEARLTVVETAVDVGTGDVEQPPRPHRLGHPHQDPHGQGRPRTCLSRQRGTIGRVELQRHPPDFGVVYPPSVNSSRFDYIVVGAGSAGCVLANRLSILGTVLLLEAGDDDTSLNVRIPAAFSKLFKTAADWDFESGPEPGAEGRRLYVPRGRLVGGSSAINAMIYIRGRRSDYDGWEEAGATGWDWETVREAFLEVEDNSRGDGPYHATGGELRVEDLTDPSPFSRRFVEGAIESGIPANPDFNGPHQEGVGLFQVNQRRGRRWSAADAFLAPVRSRPTLT